MALLTFSRRAALVAAAGAALAMSACSQAGGETANPTSGSEPLVATFAEDGVVFGAADAPVTMVEYASVTCGHCKDFHEQVMTSVKADYIKTGKVKFIFREFPTAPAQVALAGFVTARCTGEDGYMAVLDDFFASQPDILEATRTGFARQALYDLAARHGINEKKFDECLADTDIRRDIAAAMEAGAADGVNSTPTVFVNGTKLTTAASRTPEGMAAILDAALAGEPLPQSTVSAGEDDHSGHDHSEHQ